ncbi:Mitochondrial tRNA-specific 2-thiouridylase 1 [Hypsibius exemplaris]|uniref:tRNA-5-taurinomethyluridine 2-sulfurtransferase n=1 Tax=Hypsibius exemplaris TaxID=2072580 RepID=A0A1W0WCD4_HYPEX|nr:Mitochondrial tRNA-specific 2-thiouridylase 1 [Hypsibius exemplaris]
MNQIKRVVCGISGGVDSCISAYKLKHRGFDVVGVFMRNWDLTDETGHCQADKDCEDAAEICRKIGIPFHEVNFVKEYWTHVFTPLLEDYQNGLTPNPDILCNRHVKFSSFLQYAREKHNADAIATGHYARTSFGPFLERSSPEKNCLLFKGVDPLKDQTLFLSQISQEALRCTMFPIGEMHKRVVKTTARQLGSEFKQYAHKKESMGICFIGPRKFSNFMREYCPPQRGRFIDVDTGKVVGQHEGVQMYTLGQRSLISGVGAPYFVAQKYPKTQDIVVALGHDHPAMYSSTFEVDEMHWISGTPVPPRDEMELDFRFQHAHPVVPCRVRFDPEDPQKKRLTVVLTVKQFAVTPGQYAVFYDGDQCLGSGRIGATEATKFISGIVSGLPDESPVKDRLRIKVPERRAVTASC